MRSAWTPEQSDLTRDWQRVRHREAEAPTFDLDLAAVVVCLALLATGFVFAGRGGLWAGVLLAAVAVGPAVLFVAVLVRRGLYLSASGVRVVNYWAATEVPWGAVAHFRLAPACRSRLPHPPLDVLVLERRDGTAIDVLAIRRPTNYASPSGWNKRTLAAEYPRLAAFDELVDQLNATARTVAS